MQGCSDTVEDRAPLEPVRAEGSIVSTESSMSGSASGSASGSGSGSGFGTLEYDLPRKPSTMEWAVNEIVNNHVSQRRASVQWGVHRSLVQRALASVRYGMLRVRVLCFVSCIFCCVCHPLRATRMSCQSHLLYAYGRFPYTFLFLFLLVLPFSFSVTVTT